MPKMTREEYRQAIFLHTVSIQEATEDFGGDDVKTLKKVLAVLKKTLDDLDKV